MTYSDGKERRYYYDDKDRRWNGKRCPDCHNQDADKRRRAKGRDTVDTCMEPTRRKGRLAEKLVADYLGQLGFAVTLTKYGGYDIVASTRGALYKIEVKSTVKYKGKDYYLTGRVWPDEQDADLVVIVLPSGKLWIDTMVEHLRHCAPTSGHRYITSIVRSDSGLSPTDHAAGRERINFLVKQQRRVGSA